MASLLAQNTKLLETKHGIKTNVGTVASPIASTIGTKANSAPVTGSNDFLANTFNSIRNGISAGVAGVGNVLKRTFYDEPAALGNAYGTKLMNMLQAPGQAQQAGKNFRNVFDTATANYRSGKLSFEDYSRIMRSQAASTLNQAREGQTAINDFGRAMTHRDSDYNAKALPVALTVGSLLSPMIKPIAVGSNATKLGRVAQAGGNFVNDTFGLGQTFTSNPALQIAGKLARNELIVRPTVDSLVHAPQDVMNIIQGKDRANSAVNLAGIAAPALLTGAQKAGKAAAKFIGKNIFDTSGVFDRIVLKDGKTINQALSAMKKEASASKDVKLLRNAKKTENELRVIQDMLLQESGGNHKLAAQKFMAYESDLLNTRKQDLPGALKEVKKVIQARLAVQKLPQEAITVGGKALSELGDVGNITVARLTKEKKSQLITRLVNATDKQAELKAIKKEGLVTNPTLLGQLDDIVKGEPNLVKGRLNELTAVSDNVRVNGKSFQGQLPNDYIPVFSKGAAVIRDAKDTQALVTGNEARFGKVGEFLRKAGISPEQVTAEDNKFVFTKFRNEFVKRIDGIGGKTGNNIYKSLNELADRKIGVTDIRQLSKRSIADHLHISTDEAGKILKEAKGSYKVLSLAERGMAGKLMDFNLRVNPLAGPYSRVQSVARYEKNPFFRLQENIETRFGVASMGGKQAVPLTKQYDETINKLNKHGIFTSGYGAEGADTFSGSFTGVRAKLSRDQQANIAATIEKFAGGPNKVDDWLRNPKNADLLNDFKTIVQYPDKGFTSSNMAKMMNLVAFPSRYNLKVTQFAVKQFMKQPAPVQIAMIRGLKDFNDFTKSPEGIKWQAENKEAIGLLSYFTPIQPIKSVFDTITGKNKSIGEIGMVGGLPFGVLTRILQGQGVLKDRVPYVDPRTGKVYSDKIPEDLKARAETLLNSIIDTLYTYPGRMAGLPAKKDITEGLVSAGTFGKLKDGQYSSVDRSGDVTPEQQRQIQILQSMQQGALPKGQLARGITPFVTTNSPQALPSIPNVQPIYKKKKAKKVKPIAKPIASLL